MSNEIAYLSFDIETDGPSVLKNSMISLGIVLITENSEIIDQLSVNILEREGCIQDPDTMNFWGQHKNAWDLCHVNQVTPTDAMTQVSEFWKRWQQKYKLKWMAMPVCFDWMFLKAYYTTFAPFGAPNIGYKALCGSSIREFAIKLKLINDKKYKEIEEKFSYGAEHVAIDDAIQQGKIFVWLLDITKEKVKLLK